MPNKEPILKDNKDRFVIFPVKHNDIWDCFKQMQPTFWTAEEVDLHQDRQDWSNKLNNQEREYLKLLLASMASPRNDHTNNITRDVKYPEAQSFFAFQQMAENTHTEIFSLLFRMYVPEGAEYEELPEQIESLLTTSNRNKWFLDFEFAPFAEKLIAMAASKGIFYAGAFCAITRLKNRNLMPGLSFTGNLVSRDLLLHRNFAAHLHNNHLVNRVSKARIREILLQAYNIENQFNTGCLPVNMIGLNPAATTQYLEFVTDTMLEVFGCEKEFGSENPFAFMDRSTLPQAGILKRRAGELKKAGKEQDLNKINQNAGQQAGNKQV